jgi:hypothetical protein
MIDSDINSGTISSILTKARQSGAITQPKNGNRGYGPRTRIKTINYNAIRRIEFESHQKLKEKREKERLSKMYQPHKMEKTHEDIMKSTSIVTHTHCETVKRLHSAKFNTSQIADFTHLSTDQVTKIVNADFNLSKYLGGSSRMLRLPTRSEMYDDNTLFSEAMTEIGDWFRYLGKGA